MNLRSRSRVALLAAVGLVNGWNGLRAQSPVQIPAPIPEQDARNTTVPNTDTHFTMPVYRSLAEWESRKAHLRKQILAAAGLMPMPAKTPLHPVISGRLEREGYSIEKVYLESLPGYYVCGNLYRPLGPSGKHPGVLLTQGHWTYGRLENSPNASAPTLGVSMALQGYVAFSYDMTGYNDMVQTPHEFGDAARAVVVFRTAGPSVVELDSRAGLPAISGGCGCGQNRHDRCVGRRLANFSFDGHR